MARIGLLAVLLAACGIAVPEDRREYVGAWQGPGMTLLITADGRVEYERGQGGMTTSIKAPLRRFEGDDFVVGISLLATRFVVQRPPFRDGDRWKMQVDGVELVRVTP